MIKSPYEKYRQSSVQTSTPAQLVIMLYDGAIRFVKVGLEGLNNQDIEKANLNLGKAQTIISELMSTLDQSYDVSKNLFALYEYTNYLLIEANIRKSPEKAEEAIGYLTDLRETWMQASKLASTQTESAHG
ncbi:flagellar export chaperone FliS [Paenibacillus sp. FSL H7-0942]|uniref:flagellar export chaperone FliS n=1 Tax=Paenibacillus TaxID=44249 RepID=UPI0003E1C3DA|nr:MULTISPECIES: flagellar export chaperone FliS [Paenibacillus]ETT48892.1 flagellin-specific chaperone flis [Paenibacillus sp. FSL H7-689]MCP1423334.1 flagellar protein FliS [Paenibacillus xylanexedens]OMF04647.1 flagellar export chaperone FliS [Paenibacillus amylolyticus]OMF66612.1 flagellar export chaperone FliS [Paenibacillus sp. FSL R5-0765]